MNSRAPATKPRSFLSSRDGRRSIGEGVRWRLRLSRVGSGADLLLSQRGGLRLGVCTGGWSQRVGFGRLVPESLRHVHLSLPLLTREEKVRTVIEVGNPGPPLLTLSGGGTSLNGNRGCLLSVGANLGSLTSTAALTLPTFALGLPVGFPHVFLHVLGFAGSLVTGPDNDGNGGSGVNCGRCSLGARTVDSVSSRTFFVEGLLSLLGCSGFPSGKLLPVLFKGLVHDTGVEGFSVRSAARC
jgi:hypothetical protein